MPTEKEYEDALRAADRMTVAVDRILESKAIHLTSKLAELSFASRDYQQARANMRQSKLPFGA